MDVYLRYVNSTWGHDCGCSTEGGRTEKWRRMKWFVLDRKSHGFSEHNVKFGQHKELFLLTVSNIQKIESLVSWQSMYYLVKVSSDRYCIPHVIIQHKQTKYTFFLLNFWCLLQVSKLVGSSSGRQLYMQCGTLTCVSVWAVWWIGECISTQWGG